MSLAPLQLLREHAGVSLTKAERHMDQRHVAPASLAEATLGQPKASQASKMQRSLRSFFGMAQTQELSKCILHKSLVLWSCLLCGAIVGINS